jgi:hypothetical protein
LVYIAKPCIMLRGMKMRFCVALALGLASACVGSVAALAQEREWSLDATEREAFLVFGVPDTDDVGLSFWCAIGSGKISLYLPLTVPMLRAGQRADMSVDVDGKLFHLTGTAAKGDIDGHMTVEGPFRLKDKLLLALKGAAGITVTIKGRSTTYPLNDADFSGLESACDGTVDSGASG